MGIFSKLSEILNVSLGGPSRDPEVEAQRLLREIDSQVEEIETRLAAAIVREKTVEVDLEESRGEASRLEEQAREAIRKGRDALARERLLSRRRFAMNIEHLEPQLESARADARALRGHLSSLKERRREIAATGPGPSTPPVKDAADDATVLEACIDDEIQGLRALDEVESELSRLRKGPA